MGGLSADRVLQSQVGGYCHSIHNFIGDDPLVVGTAMTRAHATAGKIPTFDTSGKFGLEL